MTVDLDRQFVEYHDGEQSDVDEIAHFWSSDATLGWADLLKRRRIVLLAEAGSGKTTEMEARAKQLSAAEHFAFFATAQDIGQRGLDGALSSPAREDLARWRQSDKDAWFFVDSVDEAKQVGVKLRATLVALADGISGFERRAHVILSGRYTDWQFRRDLVHFQERLPLPTDEALPPPVTLTSDELVQSAIHRDRHAASATEPKGEDPLVVVMAGLDKERVRRFAAAKAVPNLDSFLSQVEDANLWQFARRPLDLDWLVQFWLTHRRLGSLAEMLQECLVERLNESNLDRARLDDLDAKRALSAVERIAGAMIFGRRETIAIPDTEISVSDKIGALEIVDVLPDWSAKDQERLLSRAVFDPATFGRARLHNDNQGVVRCYLTASWLRRLRRSNLSQRRLFDLLFADQYGIQLVRPSMQQTAAWMA